MYGESSAALEWVKDFIFGVLGWVMQMARENILVAITLVTFLVSAFIGLRMSARGKDGD